MKKRVNKSYHINPKFRAYGKARLDIAQRASSEEEWDRLWKKPAHPFPFAWEGQWKQCIEYKVDDFAAEVGFFTDILGLPILAIDPAYVMFTSPAGDFYFSVVPALDGEPSTPPEAFRIQFMIANIQGTALELDRRGIPFDLWPQPSSEGSSLNIGYFRTPHGICIELWGKVEASQVEINEVEPGFEEGERDEEVESSTERFQAYPEEEVSTDRNEQTTDSNNSRVDTDQEEESEELIQFGFFAPQNESTSLQADEAFPPADDEAQEEVVELEYEYIDEDV